MQPTKDRPTLWPLIIIWSCPNQSESASCPSALIGGEIAGRISTFPPRKTPHPRSRSLGTVGEALGRTVSEYYINHLVSPSAVCAIPTSRVKSRITSLIKPLPHTP